MNTRPRLHRSIPFWALVVGSLASAAAGGALLFEKLSFMEAALTNQTATGVEVYVGQIWAVFGAILVGAGIIGLALALTLGALRSFAPAPAPVADVAPVEEGTPGEDDLDADASAAGGYDRGLGYTGLVTTVDEPATSR